MNYSGRLVTNSNMAAPDEFIFVINTNGKAAVWQHFGLIKNLSVILVRVCGAFFFYNYPNHIPGLRKKSPIHILD